MSKIIALRIVFSFVLLSFTSISGNQIYNQTNKTSDRGNILYVGSNGEGNYTKIQDAVDNASDGDTVFVYYDSSPYYENVVIDKSINLIGEEKDITIIDGGESGSGVTISVDWVNISGFTFQNCGHSLYEAGVCIEACHNTIFGNNIINNGGGIYFFDDSNTLSDNIIINNYYGICIYEGEYNSILNNIITNNKNIGIGPYGSFSNTYSGNTITNNEFGIAFHDFTEDNIISSNNITYNAWGIYLGFQDSHTIIGNSITYNDYGIYLQGSCFDNIINNTFTNNYYGLYLKSESSSNNIYHNNFLNNNPNVEIEDNYINTWDDGYPSGGNYWDDYSGHDNNTDGLGDYPYLISKDNMDRFPLMEPYGNLRVNTNGPYYGFIDKKIQFEGFVCGGVTPYSWNWDLGDGNTSDKQNVSHSYSTKGKYPILLSVTDSKGNISNHTSYAWIQTTNTEPDKPMIDGPTNGIIRVTYEYTFSATDPDNSSLYLFVDWGDSTNTGWEGPYESGQQVVLSHKWSQQGTYTIKAKAKDPYDAEGPWGELSVTMPRDKTIFCKILCSYLERFPILQRLIDVWRYNIG